jgi:predicted permease
MTMLLRRHGAYVAFATTSLALAVGATLTVFTIVNALWLQPLPFPDADRLVTLVAESGDTDAPFVQVETFPRWKIFEAVAGQVVTSGAFAGLTPHLVLDEVGREVEMVAVTPQYFTLFGQSIRGRDFTRDDDLLGAEPVAIISDRLWRRAFGARLDKIGAVAAAKPAPIRIIGVAPPGFEGVRRGERADLWIPSNLVQRLAIGGSALAQDRAPTMIFGRLRPGQTPAEVRQHLLQDPDNWSRRSMERTHVVPLTDVFGTPDSRSIAIRERGAATVVAGLAGLVLVAGCATLMALVLVHYERRRRELAVRVALGAARATLVRQLSAELAWVALAGGSAALLMSFWSLRSLPSLSLPGGVDLARLDLSPDWRVLMVSVLTTIVTLVISAFVPIRRFTNADVASELMASSVTTSRSSQRLRQLLLTLHVSATIVVLVAAGLFVRAVVLGFSAGPRFDVDRTAYVAVETMPGFMAPGENLDRRMAIANERARQLRERLGSLPGVERVASGWAPLGVEAAGSVLTPKTVETTGVRRDLRVGAYFGSPEVLSTLGVPLLKGRALTAADATTRPASAIVTASLARTLWNDDEALGQFVSLGGRYGRYTIVGIAQDFAFGSMNEPIAGVVFSVNSGGYGIDPKFIVRTDRPDLQVEAIRTMVKEVIPDAPRVTIVTGHELVARDLGRQRLGAWFFSGFGLIALVLGAGGVFGLVAYLAESRRREFGIRLALGATSNDLVRRGVVAGLVPVAIGVAAGLVAAALVARVFVALLPGLSALDPLTYTSVGLLMIGGATLSGLGAAWRLRSIAPADALRAE